MTEYYSLSTYTVDKGECYSGAWFGRSLHLAVHPQLATFNTSKRQHLLKRSVCEDSTYWFLHKMHRHGPANYLWGTPPGQSIDVFDFSVFHLSTSDRLLHRNPDTRNAKASEVNKTLLVNLS